MMMNIKAAGKKARLPYLLPNCSSTVWESPICHQGSPMIWLPKVFTPYACSTE
jgi:hypothetical protein